MNRTQKAAWFGLIVPCFPVAWFLSVGIITNSTLLMVVPIVLFLLIVPAVMIKSISKKQSPAEVISDERDNMIKAKAVMACFISVWVMHAFLISVMHLISNDKGMVEVDIMFPSSILIFIISIAVYSAAILLQYGKGVQSYE